MSGEGCKGGFHACAMMLAATMGSYNLLRFAETNEKRNAANALIYAAILAHEWKQTRYHWGNRD